MWANELYFSVNLFGFHCDLTVATITSACILTYKSKFQITARLFILSIENTIEKGENAPKC